MLISVLYLGFLLNVMFVLGGDWGVWDKWCEDNSILANYLTPIKYIGKDKRFKGNKEFFAQRDFYKQFPRPPLKRLHERVAEQCDKGVLQCVREIKSNALRSWSLQSTWFGKHGRTEKLSPYADRFFPFESELEEFQYKITAMYYMCWFTMLRVPNLKHILAGYNCLSAIKESNDILEFKTDEDYFKIEDIRLDKTPFQCAEIFFCPEPCYAHKNHGLVTEGYSRKADIDNPCFDLKTNDDCSWLPSANTEMDDLMKNHLNYTCKCELNFQKGFEWNLKFKICVDIDECYNGESRCPPDQVCQNTRGSYLCHCKRGYRYNSQTEVCEEHFTLPKAKFVSKRKTPKPPGVTFTRQLEILIGLESSGSNLQSSLIICSSVFTWYCILAW